MKQLSYRMENHDLIKIESFVNSTPYPSYDEMVDNLENNIELDTFHMFKLIIIVGIRKSCYFQTGPPALWRCKRSWSVFHYPLS